MPHRPNSNVTKKTKPKNQAKRPAIFTVQRGYSLVDRGKTAKNEHVAIPSERSILPDFPQIFTRFSTNLRLFSVLLFKRRSIGTTALWYRPTTCTIRGKATFPSGSDEITHKRKRRAPATDTKTPNIHTQASVHRHRHTLVCVFFFSFIFPSAKPPLVMRL